jgi:hypothetical protein
VPQGVSVELSGGYAFITFPDPSKRGPALAKLLEAGVPVKVDTSGRNSRGYRVHERDALNAGLIDVPGMRSTPLSRPRALMAPRPASGVSRPPRVTLSPKKSIGPRVILFVFAGRRPNMELQLPFVRRILAENPDVDYHIWDLARTRRDSDYLQTITGDRITVHNEFRRTTPGYDSVYRHYAESQYQDCVFVKIDDDIVFLQTERFRDFVDAVKANPNVMMSANIINNGACTSLEPSLMGKFRRLGIPLLDVHKSTEYAAMAHNYFFDHHQDLLEQPIKCVPTTQWLSINTIGYTATMATAIANKVGSTCGTAKKPKLVAGRALTSFGDEGLVNTFPRSIMRGFLSCHLTFGPQNLTDEILAPWRSRYGEIGQGYLAATAGQRTAVSA